jgi:hypothetical protein
MKEGSAIAMPTAMNATTITAEIMMVLIFISLMRTSY